jgi:Ca2+-binding RTX toxin-like protein
MRARLVATVLAPILLAGSLVAGSATGDAKAPRCTIKGTPGDDVLRGTGRANVLCGGGGDDRISGKGGADTLRGGGGKDLLRGGGGADLLEGGGGADRLKGQGGDDVLNGGGGRDQLDGGPGLDVLDGVAEQLGPDVPGVPAPPPPGVPGNQPPAITELDFNPRQIDTSGSAATTTLRFRAQDDTEVRSMLVDLQGPRPAARLGLFADESDLISGDVRNGVYEVPVMLPRHSAPGQWRIEFFTVYDDQFTGPSYSYADLTALGFDPGFVQIGDGDEQQPELRGFTVTPEQIDVTDGGAAQFEIDISVADELSGLRSWTLAIHADVWGRTFASTRFFNGQLEVQREEGFFFPPGPDPGNPPPPPAGRYEYTVTVTDIAYNQRTYTSEELESLGFTSGFDNGPPP